MVSKLCRYSNVCPIYNGTLKEDDKPSFTYRNIFCEQGNKGWSACKRFQIYSLKTESPENLFPGSNEPIDNLLRNDQE